MKHVISIDLGGTKIKYALVNEQYEIIYFNEVDSFADQSSESVVNQLFFSIKDCVNVASKRSLDIFGVGLGTPGIVDLTGKIVLGGADNIVGWENIPIAEMIEKEFDLPAIIENDANAMALGELADGAGVGCQNVIFLTIGTGIGGAMFINGAVFNGHQNRGGELGHIPLIINGEKCSCGADGCLEQYASTSALVRRFEKRCQEKGIVFDEEINGRLIVDLYHKGDKLATELLNEHCSFIGRGVAAYINIFSPEKVLIGGGISEAGDFYIDKISKTAFDYSMPACSVNTKVERAKLGGRAACIGAAKLAFEMKL